jgi:Spy/CpxP family protein refolding chaperone
MHRHPWAWRRARRGHGCGSFGFDMREGCGPEGRSWGWGGGEFESFEAGGGGGFGIRRPLRFLRHKLDLDEGQAVALARILDELKTERAQAEVDRRRTVAALADAVAGDAFDAAKATEGGDLRVKSATHLRDAVLKALQQIHSILNPEQRGRLAYLIRTGTLMI